MPMMTRKLPRYKQTEVEALTRLLRDNPVVAVVEVGGIPGAQLAQMRARLGKDSTLRVAKNTLVARAIDEVAPTRRGLETLAPHIPGRTALVATTLNPFKLFTQLEGTKQASPAKGGEIAPADINI